MNEELRRELHDLNIHLLTIDLLNFLDDVDSVIQDKILRRCSIDLPDDEDKLFEIKRQVAAMEENFEIIISSLKGGRGARNLFIQTYPNWKKVYEGSIEKLKEIAGSINSDRHKRNVSKLVGYCTSFLGGTLLLGAAVSSRFGLRMTELGLTIASGSLIGYGLFTTIRTYFKEIALLKLKTSLVHDIINEERKYYEDMSEWLKHAAGLEKALCEVLNTEIFYSIIQNETILVQRASKIQNDTERLKKIEISLNRIIDSLPETLWEAAPLFPIATLTFVTIYLLLNENKNRVIFDCARRTVESVESFALLPEKCMDEGIRLSRFFSGGAAVSIDTAKVLTRSAVEVFCAAVPVAGIALTSIDLYKGSLSPEAQKIAKAAEEMKGEEEDMEEEAKAMGKVYEILRYIGTFRYQGTCYISRRNIHFRPSLN